MIIIFPKSPNLSRFKCLFTNKPVISRHKCTLATSVRSPQAFRIRPLLISAHYHPSPPYTQYRTKVQTSYAARDDDDLHLDKKKRQKSFLSLYVIQPSTKVFYQKLHSELCPPRTKPYYLPNFCV